MNGKCFRSPYVLILLIVLFIPVTLQAQESLSGIVSGELEAGEYTIDGDVTVNDSLIIAPGTRLMFNGNYSIYISGRFEAIGTEEDSIYFELYEDISYWSNITLFAFSEDTIHFDHCYFTGANASAIYVTSGTNVLINNCTFYDNFASYGAGISIANSAPVIRNCHFENNQSQRSGGAIHANDSQPVIDNCTFVNNDGGNWGGALNFYNGSTGILKNSRITDNFCSATGGGIHCSNSSPTIDSCLIEDNHANSYGGGINIYNNSNPLIKRTIIRNNDCTNSGGGIYSTRSEPTIDHCIITGNDATNGWGDGIYFYAADDERKEPVLTNSVIFANNGYGVYMMNVDPYIAFNNAYDNNSGNFSGQLPTWLGVFSHQNGAGTSCDLMYNITAAPLFIDDDYNLDEDSPCIDTGDFLAELDPDDTITDMGVQYFDHANGLEAPSPPATSLFTGSAQLRYMNDHTDIEVIFDPISPSAEADTFYTDVNGAYSGTLIRGIYDVYFSHENFHSDTLSWVLVNQAIPITPMILDPIGISGDTSGVMEAGTYVISGDLHVAENDTLTLNPGCTFLFDDGMGLDIDGLLIAEGTATDSIKFMPLQEYWDGIEFTMTADNNNIFRYCYISGSNSGGIETESTNLNIEHCVISGNSAQNFGCGVYAISNCILNISNTIFSQNTASGNQTEGGAISIYYDCILNLENSTLYGNTAEYGSALLARSSTMNVRNTIVDSHSTGPAVMVYQPVENNFTYNIFNMNEGGNFQGEFADGLGELITANVNGDSSDAFLNLFQDPLFADTNTLDLSPDSPCINAGDSDLALDLDDTVSDIGAGYYHVSGSHIRVVNSALNFGGVPVNETVNLYLPIVNIGLENLVLNSVYTNADEFTVENISNLVIEPYERVEIEITFAPTTMNLYNAILTIENNDAEQFSREIPLTGIGQENAVGDNHAALPEVFDIEQIYPNPFNSQTRVKIALPNPGILKVYLYNALGQQVMVVSENFKTAGWHEFQVNAENLASGFYFIRAANSEINITRKMILVR